mmetsp:Transcript_13986/g.42210  ORF Transcript_13986/g.42210 Transcript_13986/m.42210 type:complete len:477 (-) Transcript_13986:708-2138(-)
MSEASSGLDGGDSMIVGDTHRSASETASECEEEMLLLEACAEDTISAREASATGNTFADNGDWADPHAQTSDATALVREKALGQQSTDCVPARATAGAGTDIMGSSGPPSEAEHSVVPIGDSVGARGGGRSLLAGTVTVSRGALCLAAVVLVGLGWSLAVLPWMGSHASTARVADLRCCSAARQVAAELQRLAEGLAAAGPAENHPLVHTEHPPRRATASVAWSVVAPVAAAPVRTAPSLVDGTAAARTTSPPLGHGSCTQDLSDACSPVPSWDSFPARADNDAHAHHQAADASSHGWSSTAFPHLREHQVDAHRVNAAQPHRSRQHGMGAGEGNTLFTPSAWDHIAPATAAGVKAAHHAGSKLQQNVQQHMKHGDWDNHIASIWTQLSQHIAMKTAKRADQRAAKRAAKDAKRAVHVRRVCEKALTQENQRAAKVMRKHAAKAARRTRRQLERDAKTAAQASARLQRRLRTKKRR